MTALRLFQSTFLTAAENLLFLAPWRVFDIALDILFYNGVQIQIDQGIIDMELIKSIVLIVLLVAHLEGKMIIQSPSDLSLYFKTKYTDGSIPYSIANYGVVPYGKMISGEIGIPEFLEDCVYEEIPSDAKKNIILVERNDCTFTQKSINVQKQGGKLAIIMDNKVERSQDIVMKDDGKGHFVNIPTVLISKQDGQKILQYINQHPIISVSFDLNSKSKSDVTLWIDILDHKNYIFLRKFQSYYNQISKDINFNVAYPTSRCSTSCSQSNCFYDGKYCRYSFGFSSVENAGKEIIREQLRQYHIFKENPSKWWDYMLQFDDRCNDVAVYQECSNKITNQLSIGTDKLKKSVDLSFNDEDNAILRDFSEQKYSSSILYYPSIVINNMIYRGNLQPYEVFETICSSMDPTPASCLDNPTQNNSQLTTWIVFGVISVILFGLFLIICFRRIARRQLSMQMNKKVNQLVNEYISMYEVQKFKQGESERKNSS